MQKIVKIKPRSLGLVIKRWLWFFLLIAYTVYFGYLLLFNKLENLVSPRLTVFVVLGFVVLLLLCIVQGLKLWSRAPTPRMKEGLVMLFVPLAFFPFTLSANSSLLASGGGMSIEQGGPSIDLTTRLQKAANPFLPPPKPKLVSKDGVIPAEGPITLDQHNYYAVYKELYSNPAAFDGRTIRATGFVYADGNSPGNKVVVARELMWCCAADAVAIGFLTRSDQTAALKADSWVAVTGTLGTTKYVDKYTSLSSSVPLINVTQISFLKEPDFEFVYPD